MPVAVTRVGPAVIHATNLATIPGASTKATTSAVTTSLWSSSTLPLPQQMAPQGPSIRALTLLAQTALLLPEAGLLYSCSEEDEEIGRSSPRIAFPPATS